MALRRACTIICLALLYSSACHAVVSPDQHGLPFDDANTWEQGRGVGELTANKQTGALGGGVHVKTGGAIYAMWGEAETSVRWTFQYSGSEPAFGTPAVSYTINDSSLSAGGGSVATCSSTSIMEFGVRITDNQSGDRVKFLLDRRDDIHNILSPLVSGAYRYSPNGVQFQPGHTYSIDVFLHVAASAYSDVNGLTKQVTDSSEASASASATVTSVRLQDMSPPWIETSLRRPNSPAQDTYNTYEDALQSNSGRAYFEAGCWVTVSAGGHYSNIPGHSFVKLQFPQSHVTRLAGCSMQSVIAQDGHSVDLILPPSGEMPLGGKTWRFIAVFDPEFKLPTDDVAFAPKFLGHFFGTLLDLERAAQEPVTAAASEGSADTKAAPAKSPAPSSTRAGGSAATADYVFDASNWVVVLPAARFEELSASPNLKTSRATPKLNATVWTPPGGKKLALDKSNLTIKPVGQLKLAPGINHDFNTEPVVLISVLELWQQLTQVQFANGTSLCANPRFIQFLERLADDVEAQREFLDGLYYKAPSGELYKLTNLVEEMRENPPTLIVNAQQKPVPVWIPRRLARVLRHVLMVERMADFLRDLRPTQKCTVSINGEVRNAAGQSDLSSDNTYYHVLFDFVPRLQPQPLSGPDSIGP